jgi:hypothetical protein
MSLCDMETSLPGNDPANAFPHQRTHTQPQKNCRTRRIEGNEVVNSSQRFLLYLQRMFLCLWQWLSRKYATFILSAQRLWPSFLKWTSILCLIDEKEVRKLPINWHSGKIKENYYEWSQKACYGNDSRRHWEIFRKLTNKYHGSSTGTAAWDIFLSQCERDLPVRGSCV